VATVLLKDPENQKKKGGKIPPFFIRQLEIIPELGAI
jgi:hypothetical protein